VNVELDNQQSARNSEISYVELDNRHLAQHSIYNNQQIFLKVYVEQDNQQSARHVASYFSKNLLNADKNMLKQGNYSEIPNKAVLRKIVSEILEEEQLHQNILAELDVS
jgi:hypothetical protein